ncbi:MAG: hypothetical protein IAE64_09340 [Flavobacteriales bacterium]|nr:MAG: hypothetical protein F9K28_01290 [Bacteroidota bacterium]MBE2266438.1 hypothetical protein [Flavobacteriales bacterium]MBZ0194619.1 hypothetical protein [Candidatus Kapabacteria bacterium]MCC6331168.1 hypothetical protein [Ignavibacteria bacterium]NOG66882.1 hypothetical protein [Chlorobiota bacterium]
MNFLRVRQGVLVKGALWMVLFAVTATGSGSLIAQELRHLQGIWINATWIELIKRTESVAKAMSEFPEGQPLWVRFDVARPTVIDVGYRIDEAIPMTVNSRIVGHMGERVVIDSAGKGLWLVSPDIQADQYVALHYLSDMELPPIVMAKLPTKRTDPQFLFDRMIIASVLGGRWMDTKGHLLEFMPDATANWKGETYGITIEITAEQQLRVMLTDAGGRTKRFIAERTGPRLVLTDADGRTSEFTASSR